MTAREALLQSALSDLVALVADDHDDEVEDLGEMPHDPSSCVVCAARELLTPDPLVTR